MSYSKAVASTLSYPIYIYYIYVYIYYVYNAMHIFVYFGPHSILKITLSLYQLIVVNAVCTRFMSFLSLLMHEAGLMTNHSSTSGDKVDVIATRDRFTFGF